MIDRFLLDRTFRDLLRPKRLLTAVTLMLVPTLFAGLNRLASGRRAYGPTETYGIAISFLVFGFVLVILSLVFSTGIVAQEIEQKTIVYLLTRPVARWRILINKFAAVSVVTCGVVWASAILLALVTIGPRDMFGAGLLSDLAVIPIGVLAYSALFLLLATRFNRAMVIGLVFAFGWETWVPTMPGNFRKLSIMTYLHVLAPHGDTVSTLSARSAWAVLFGVIVVGLIGALWSFSVLEYSPRDDAE